MSIENIHELISWQPPVQQSIIEEGILLPETRLMIFGAAKAWKSMLSIHTAFALANGTDWFGYKTTKCLPLKYQVELPKAIDRKRIIKYAKGANSYPSNLFFKTAVYSKLDTGYGIGSIERDIQTAKQRIPDQHIVLILDPLYLLMSGHITDEYDVRKLLDNLDSLRDKHHLTIIIIHHSRLARTDASGSIIDLGPEEAMGSSYLNNWVDTMIKVVLLNPYTGGNRVGMSFELTRHAETMLPSFQVEWSRSNLQPRVIKRATVELDEPSIRVIDKVE